MKSSITEEGKGGNLGELQLQATYLSLNPADLKISIGDKLNQLLEAYKSNNNAAEVDPHKGQVPRTVTWLNGLTRNRREVNGHFQRRK